MSNNKVEITGSVIDVRWPPNCENFFIGTIQLIIDGQPAERTKLCGSAEPDEIKQHLSYRWYGKWSDDPKWGRQFKVETFTPAKPHGRTGVVKYLQQCDGIGEATAVAIWNAFNSDAVRICREHPDIIAQKIPRLKLPQCEAMAAVLKDLSALEDVGIEMIDLLNGRGFPKATARAVIKKYGNNALRILQADPYKLMAHRGCGFLRCDSMYMDLGLPPAKMKRQCYAVWYSLASSTDGHTWLPETTARQYLSAKISGAEVDYDKALALAKRAGLVREKFWCNTCQGTGRAMVPDFFGDGTLIDVGCPSCDGGTRATRWLAEAKKADAEEYIAEHIAKAELEKPIWPVVLAADPEQPGPSEHQAGELAKALRGEIGLLLGSPGTGKAQPLDAKVLTPKGWREMGSLKAGEQVCAPDGTTPRIKAVFPQGMKPVFRVNFSDGTSTECCDDHLWFTVSRKERQTGKPGKVRSLRQIRETLDRGDGSANHAIPMVGRIDLDPGCELPLDPYLMGLLLGDGCFRGGIPSFSKPDAELVSAVAELIPAGGQLGCAVDSPNDHQIQYGRSKRNLVRDALEQSGLWGKYSTEKFIPPAYMTMQFDDRVALMQGLLDTDGYCEKSGICIEYSTSSAQLAEQFAELVQSLGGVVTSTKRLPKYEYKGESRTGQESWRILVVLPPGIKPFRLPRKLQRYRERTKYPPRRRIIAVTPIGEKECQCISIDSPDGLYVTNNYIVTHNTYVAAAVVQALLRKHSPFDIAIVAPTGKAAVRCTQSMASYGIKSRASTIHGLLGVESGGDEGWSFQHNERNPLPYKFIIVDESSMIDVPLMASLLRARAKGTHILFVGDPNQLPPIGHGAPLRDFIAAGLPHGKLTEIRRNAGTIVRACAAIRDNRPFEMDPEIVLERPCPTCIGPDSGLGHCDTSDCPTCARTGKDPAFSPQNLKLVTASKAMAATEIEKIILGLRERGIDPIWNVQVIVAVNKRSALARTVLNPRLQTLLNPAGIGCIGSPFKTGDKVICLKNSFFKPDDPYAPAEEKVAVANGEFGKVYKVEPKKTCVEFFNPPRKVAIGRFQATGKADSKDDDDKEKEDSSGSGCDLDLGYACTGHKMQGSDCDYVIVGVDEYPGATGPHGVCKREWIFTGISRARIACYLVGLRGTLRTQCAETSLDKRKTFLQELIDQYRKSYQQPAKELPLCTEAKEIESVNILATTAATAMAEMQEHPLANL